MTSIPRSESPDYEESPSARRIRMQREATTRAQQLKAEERIAIAAQELTKEAEAKERNRKDRIERILGKFEMNRLINKETGDVDWLKPVAQSDIDILEEEIKKLSGEEKEAKLSEIKEAKLLKEKYDSHVKTLPLYKQKSISEYVDFYSEFHKPEETITVEDEGHISEKARLARVSKKYIDESKKDEIAEQAKAEDSDEENKDNVDMRLKDFLDLRLITERIKAIRVAFDGMQGFPQVNLVNEKKSIKVNLQQKELIIPNINQYKTEIEQSLAQFKNATANSFAPAGKREVFKSTQRAKIISSESELSQLETKVPGPIHILIVTDKKDFEVSFLDNIAPNPKEINSRAFGAIREDRLPLREINPESIEPYSSVKENHGRDIIYSTVVVSGGLDLISFNEIVENYKGPRPNLIVRDTTINTKNLEVPVQKYIKSLLRSDVKEELDSKTDYELIEDLKAVYSAKVLEIDKDLSSKNDSELTIYLQNLNTINGLQLGEDLKNLIITELKEKNLNTLSSFQLVLVQEEKIEDKTDKNLIIDLLSLINPSKTKKELESYNLPIEIKNKIKNVIQVYLTKELNEVNSIINPIIISELEESVSSGSNLTNRLIDWTKNIITNDSEISKKVQEDQKSKIISSLEQILASDNSMQPQIEEAIKNEIKNQYKITKLINELPESILISTFVRMLESSEVQVSFESKETVRKQLAKYLLEPGLNLTEQLQSLSDQINNSPEIQLSSELNEIIKNELKTKYSLSKLVDELPKNLLLATLIRLVNNPKEKITDSTKKILGGELVDNFYIKLTPLQREKIYGAISPELIRKLETFGDIPLIAQTLYTKAQVPINFNLSELSLGEKAVEKLKKLYDEVNDMYEDSITNHAHQVEILKDKLVAFDQSINFLTSKLLSINSFGLKFTKERALLKSLSECIVDTVNNAFKIRLNRIKEASKITLVDIGPATKTLILELESTTNQFVGFLLSNSSSDKNDKFVLEIRAGLNTLKAKTSDLINAMAVLKDFNSKQFGYYYIINASPTSPLPLITSQFANGYPVSQAWSQNVSGRTESDAYSAHDANGDKLRTYGRLLIYNPSSKIEKPTEETVLDLDLVNNTVTTDNISIDRKKLDELKASKPVVLTKDSEGNNTQPTSETKPIAAVNLKTLIVTPKTETKPPVVKVLETPQESAPEKENFITKFSNTVKSAVANVAGFFSRGWSKLKELTNKYLGPKKPVDKIVEKPEQKPVAKEKIVNISLADTHPLEISQKSGNPIPPPPNFEKKD